MASLSLVEENVDFIIHNGGIPKVLGAVTSAVQDMSESSLRIVESGCRAIQRLATNVIIRKTIIIIIIYCLKIDYDFILFYLYCF